MKSYVPSLITTLNLCCGFLAVLFCEIPLSLFLISLGLLFDVFDGAMARWLKVESELGKQLDSLADLISFVAAPAFLWYMFGDKNGVVDLIAPTCFVACGALRLAIFNLKESSNYFSGMPSPTAAITLLGALYAMEWADLSLLNFFDPNILYHTVPVLLGILMLSEIKMISLKGIKKQHGGIPHATFSSCMITCLIFQPSDFGWIFGLTYLLISIIFKFVPESKPK